MKMNLEMLLNTIENLIKNDVSVTTSKFQKGTELLTSISIGKGNIRPCVYMEHFEDLFKAEGYIGVAKEMIKICENADCSDMNNLGVETISSYEYVKENLLLCIAPAGIYNNIVTIPYLDLELYFRVEVGNGTYKVEGKMLDLWNVTKEELLEVALKTNDYTATSTINIVAESLKEQGATDDEIAELMSNPMQDQIVITNSDGTFGASAICKKEILKEIADELEDDLYIIPSSIHELIVQPQIDYMTKEEINYMVKSINMNDVAPEERLSDHIYIFRRDTMEIEW